MKAWFFHSKCQGFLSIIYQEEMKLQLTGAEIIIECLLEQSVDTVFGYPGGAILNVYDALYRYSDKIKHVLTSHEQELPTQQTVTLVRQERSACVWQLPAQVQPTW